MIWRQLIRGLAVALLAVCVAAWVGSYWRRMSVRHQGQAHVSLEVNWGRIRFYAGDPQLAHETPGWRLGTGAGTRSTYDVWDTVAKFQILGFAFNEDFGWRCMTIPLWFPTLFSALGLWLVWRKTRPGYNGRGFPVEVGGKDAKSPDGNLGAEYGPPSLGT
jgi:hypothetical protein